MHVISWIAAISALIFLLINVKFGIRYLMMVRGIIAVGWSAGIGIEVIRLNVTRIFGGLMPLVTLPKIIMHKNPRIYQLPLFNVSMLYLLYNFLGFAMILLSGEMSSSIQFFLRVMNGFLGFFIFQMYFNDRESFRKLLIAMLIGGLFPVVMGIYGGITGFSYSARHAMGEFQRAPGLFHNIVIIKIFTYQTIAAILLYWEYFRKGLFKRLLLIIYAMATCAAMYYCYSKSATLMFILWSVIWIILKRKYFLFILLPIAILAINFMQDGLIFKMVATIFEKEVGAIQGTADQSRVFAGRVYGWENLLERFSEAPFFNQLFGMGIMAYGAHNDYIRILMSTGIFGLIVHSFILLYVGAKITINVIRNAYPIHVIALMLYLMWVIDSIGTVVGMYPETQWLVWGMIGLSFKGITGLHEDEHAQKIKSSSGFACHDGLGTDVKEGRYV